MQSEDAGKEKRKLTTFHYILWFALTLAGFALLQLADRYYRRKNVAWMYITAFVLKILAGVGLAFCSMALSIPIIWRTGYLSMAISISLFTDAWTDLYAVIFRSIRKKAPGWKSMVVISLCLTVVYLTYGTVNMQIIHPNEHTYTSDKLTHEYTFVFLSDLHYGSAQSEQTVDNALAEIAQLKPDFVLLGGDITDENTTAEEMRSIYQKLGALPAPVYFIYGNHDRQGLGDYVGGANYTPEELTAAIEVNGITILQDETVMIADDLTLLGREDVSAGERRCKVSGLPPFSRDSFLLTVDHNPFSETDIQETGSDLQLSGHSHAGQFFPLKYIYMFGEKYVYGDYQVGNTRLYVSSGITGWYYPFRTSAHCNYEVVHLAP